MSPESIIEYYQYITRTYPQRFGDYGYPEIITFSVSFQPYVDWPDAERWDLVAHGLSQVAQRLEAAGADFIVIATHTMHLVVEQVQGSVHVPILSPPDVVAGVIVSEGIEAGQIETFLAARGFSQVRNVTGADLHARYFKGMNARRKVNTGYAIATGIV